MSSLREVLARCLQSVSARQCEKNLNTVRLNFALLFSPCSCIKLLPHSCSSNTHFVMIVKGSYQVKLHSNMFRWRPAPTSSGAVHFINQIRRCTMTVTDSFYNAEFELKKRTVLTMVVLAATETC